MLKLALPSVRVSSVQSPETAVLSVNAVSDRRYSILPMPLPESLAVTETVCDFLKNKPKDTLLINDLNLSVPTETSASGGVISATPNTVT